jgi:outer membrane protein TolC
MPDFSLSAGTDLAGITQSLSGMITVPLLRYQAINGAIAQAEANLKSAEAMRRQTGNDLAAQLITDLNMVHDADRQIDLIQNTILPRAAQVVAVVRSSYETGQASLLDLLESQRSLIAIQRLLANLGVTREKRLVEIEAITASSLQTRNTQPR